MRCTASFISWASLLYVTALRDNAGDKPTRERTVFVSSSKIFVGCLLSATMLTTAYAEQASHNPDSIVVTATRTPQPLSRIGSAISVIDALEIEKRQYQFVHDALESLPGVNVSQNGSFGGVASARIRGALSEQTLVLIDGVEVNDPSSPGSGFNFATLDPADIERIEVLRGPQSTLYGSDAIGGVVNIITKRGKEGFSLGGFVEGGSYGTVRGAATASGADGGFDYRVTASGVRTDGISKADKRDGNTEKDGHKNISLSTNLGYQVTDEFRLEGFARYSDSRTEYDGFGAVTGVADSDDETDVTEMTLNARALVTLYDGRFENIVGVSYNDIDRKNYAGGAFSFGAKGKRMLASYQGNVIIRPGTVLTFGAETEQSKMDTGFERADISISSVYSQLQIYLLDALTVTGGIRYDDHETFGGATTVRTTAAYNFAATDTKLRASWGEGFKAPTPYQLTFFCCGAAGPNLNLQPEESKGWDIGLDQTFWGGNGLFTVGYFYQKTDNLIDFAFPDGYVNINEARSKGYEVGLSATLLVGLSVDVNYTHTSAINRVTGLDLIRVPKDVANATITVEPIKNLTLALAGRYTGKSEDARGTVDDWTRIDLRASYKVTDKLDVFGRIENLLDEKYQEVWGYGTAGISGYVGLRGRF